MHAAANTQVSSCSNSKICLILKTARASRTVSPSHCRRNHSVDSLHTQNTLYGSGALAHPPMQGQSLAFDDTPSQRSLGSLQPATPCCHGPLSRPPTPLKPLATPRAPSLPRPPATSSGTPQAPLSLPEGDRGPQQRGNPTPQPAQPPLPPRHAWSAAQLQPRPPRCVRTRCWLCSF